MSGAALIFDELDDQPGDFTGAVPSPAIFDAVLARLEYGTRGSRVRYQRYKDLVVYFIQPERILWCGSKTRLPLHQVSFCTVP